jgi:hypothetical protein
VPRERPQLSSALRWIIPLCPMNGFAVVKRVSIPAALSVY